MFGDGYYVLEKGIPICSCFDNKEWKVAAIAAINLYFVWVVQASRNVMGVRDVCHTNVRVENKLW